MIKNFVNKAKNNHLIKSSVIFFIGSMIASFGAYLFQLFMGRMLSVVHYGELQSLLSIFVIIAIPSSAVSLVVVRYFSAHSNISEFAKLKVILNKLTIYFLILGIGIFLALLIFSGHISNYLQISENLKIITLAIVMIFIFLSAINKGVIQGFQQFNVLSLISIVETFVKLFSGIFLVWIGWYVYGAIVAIIFSGLVGYLYSLYFIKRKLNVPDKKEEFVVDKKEIKNLLNYVWPVFFSLLAVTCFFSLDVILVKHYFSPEDAGNYGAISVLGKIIYFVVSPLTSVLFSITAKEHSEGKNYNKSFLLSFLVVFAICIISIFVYFLFPELVIRLLLGEKYLGISVYLGLYAIAITLLSLVNLVVNFLLSIKMTRSLYFLLLGVLLQYFGIMIWHENIKQVIIVTIVIMSLVLFVLLFYYYFFNNRKNIEINKKAFEAGNIV